VLTADLLGHLTDGCDVGQINGEGVGSPAAVMNLADCFVQGGLAAGDDEHVGASRGQTLGDGPAKTMAAAGDQGPLAAQI
jgi:hypothetical protein